VLETLEPSDPAIALDDSSAAVQLCRNLAVRVRSALEREGVISVAIVSAVRGEGKTTVVCDLGLALSSLSGGRSVALLDLDLHNPSLARVLGIPAELGIEQVLHGRATLDQVRLAVQNPPIDLYPSVLPQRNAHELFALPNLGEVIRQLEQRYATVLIDTPPALLLPDTSLILKHVGACIPLARAGHTRARPFRQLMRTLPRQQILGEVLNEARAPRYSYGYEGYHAHSEDPDPGGQSVAMELPTTR
jgi:Mrp family chromosome partitioning ATPase